MLMVALAQQAALAALINAKRCAAAFGQCGGDNWDGAKCCPGTTCRVQSQYYSQCMPQDEVSSTTTHTPHMSVVGASGGHAASFGGVPHGSNLFASHPYYVGDEYQQRVKTSMQARWAEGVALAQMTRMLSVPSAFWVDRVAKIDGGGSTGGDGGMSLESLLSDAESKASSSGGEPPLVVVILYNLPNRDCHAFASNGELCCEYLADRSCHYETADSSCSAGLHEYRHQYVDRFADALARHRRVPVVVVIEPDSLPNMATNLDNPRCGNLATQSAYSAGISYAINTLSARAPHASLYLDAGHGGWLGWAQQADAFVRLVRDLDGEAHTRLRGFATNGDDATDDRTRTSPPPPPLLVCSAAAFVDPLLMTSFIGPSSCPLTGVDPPRFEHSRQLSDARDALPRACLRHHRGLIAW
jgi:cellulose 1,4-beta-cellobiosidase